MWAGIHFVGFGLIENHGNYRGNPIWDFISAIFDFELLLIKIVVGGAIVCALVVLARFILDVWQRRNDPPEHEFKPTIREPVIDYEPLNGGYHPPDSLKIEIEKPPQPLAPVQEIKTEKPTIKEKSPEELKQKAIEQILRGL